MYNILRYFKTSPWAPGHCNKHFSFFLGLTYSFLHVVSVVSWNRQDAGIKNKGTKLRQLIIIHLSWCWIFTAEWKHFCTRGYFCPPPPELQCSRPSAGGRRYQCHVDTSSCGFLLPLYCQRAQRWRVWCLHFKNLKLNQKRRRCSAPE